MTTLKRLNYGRGHGYKLDGRKVDGVTTLIGNGFPKPALIKWSAKTVAEYVADADPSTLDSLRSLGRDGMVTALKGVPWSQRDAAAVRGTEVHGYAERLSKGERIDDVPDHLAGHVESCVKFLDEWRIAPVHTELLIGSRTYRYAGTLDLIADLPDGRRALMDYKTTASGIWPETALQLAAYRYADFYVGSDGREYPMADLGINCTYGVWIRADGYDVIPVDTGSDAATSPAFAMFRASAYIARGFDVMKEWVGEVEAA